MKFSKLFSIMFMSFVFFGCNERSEIKMMDNVGAIQKEVLENSDKNTLVIFDCDDVLITMNDQIFRIKNQEVVKKCLKSLEKTMPEDLIQKTIENYWSISLLQGQRKIIDPKMPEFVRNLQNNKIKTIVLTGVPTAGTLGNIESMATWRVNDLKNFGYDFSTSFKTLQYKKFTELSKTNPPVYDRGILFSCGATKGQILESFLKYAHIKPSKIVFLDDRMSNIKSVQETVERLKIKFVGINYTGQENFKFDRSLSEERVKFQLKMLKEKGKFLSDIQADDEMAKEKRE